MSFFFLACFEKQSKTQDAKQETVCIFSYKKLHPFQDVTLLY